VKADPAADQSVMVITGTRKGIGHFLATHYLEKNWAVAGCSREMAERSHDAYVHYCLDVADEAAVRAMVRGVVERFGRIDVLVNNAGIASMNHLLLTPLATVEKIFRTNVFGTFLFARECAKVMAQRRYGRIVNFATVATPLDLEGEAAYAASKAAVESLTRILAREVAPLNITVNAVGPTPVKTDLVGGVPAEKMESLIGRQAIHRYGEFRDVANVVDFFIRPESDFVTGQVVYLGGVC
jgi:3-oxoacyl-[acyl-carrier protein] reductase